jgi:cytochrome c biogenesis protein ResB
MIRRILLTIGSLRLTIVIIIAVTILLLAGLVVPQRSVLHRDLFLDWQSSHPRLVSILDLLGLTNVYRSPLAYGLWTLFFLNLSVVMWIRVGVVRARVALHPGKLTAPASENEIVIRLPDGGDVAGIVEGFCKRRKLTYLSGNDRFYAVGNRLSPVATLVFHLSFFLILAGGLTSLYTRFTARIEITAGERFDGELSRYLEPPRLPKIGAPPAPRFMVERIEPELEQGTPVGVVVTIRDATGQVHTAEINRPFRIDGCSFVIQDLGVAPLVILSDSNGTQIDGAWVRLDVLLGKQDRLRMADLDLLVTFFPDLIFDDGVPATRSLEIINPAFVFTSGSGDEAIASEPVRLGEEVAISGTGLAVPDLRHWVRFYVRKESGLAIVWTGFALAAGALVWRFIFYRRELWGSFRRDAEGTTLVLSGRAEFYRDLFTEELAATAEELGRELEHI